MAELTGAQVVAQALKTQGVEVLYGVFGIPVIPIPSAAQKAGLRYIGTRHEQAAGFAAQAAGYLTGRIGAALCVTGPGLTNMITALGNAQANCWPMLLIAGSSTPSLDNRGDFQEAPQLEAVRPFVKWAGGHRNHSADPALHRPGGARGDQRPPRPHLCATARRRSHCARR